MEEVSNYYLQNCPKGFSLGRNISTHNYFYVPNLPVLMFFKSMFDCKKLTYTRSTVKNNQLMSEHYFK